jgi:hypothetical protein
MRIVTRNRTRNRSRTNRFSFKCRRQVSTTSPHTIASVRKSLAYGRSGRGSTLGMCALAIRSSACRCYTRARRPGYSNGTMKTQTQTRRLAFLTYLSPFTLNPKWRLIDSLLLSQVSSTHSKWRDKITRTLRSAMRVVYETHEDLEYCILCEGLYTGFTECPDCECLAVCSKCKICGCCI